MLLHIVFLNLNSQLINIAGSLKDSRLCMRYAIISGIQQTKYYFYSYFEQSSSSFLFSSRNAGETSIAHCLSLDSQEKEKNRAQRSVSLVLQCLLWSPLCAHPFPSQAFPCDFSSNCLRHHKPTLFKNKYLVASPT